MTATIHHGDCIEVMKTMPDNSVDAVVTDPPYFRVKNEPWDRQWKDAGKFIEWLGVVADQWFRVLKPNGSLYCFASPKMAAHVEVMLSGRFNVLNRIRWAKPPYSTKAEMFVKSDLRSYFPSYEEIIFCEHYGADNIAKGEAGYAAKCDELRGFLFEPLRAYLAGERDRAGFDNAAVNKAWREWRGGSGGMASHWFTASQYELPTKENYEWLRKIFSANGGSYLRREYEDLRRPFHVTADVPYTDTWTLKTVNSYPGKHVCEKPQELLSHIIKASTKPGAVVLDCFAGSGATGIACLNAGRDCVLIEKCDDWYYRCRQRVTQRQQDLF